MSHLITGSYLPYTRIIDYRIQLSISLQKEEEAAPALPTTEPPKDEEVKAAAEAAAPAAEAATEEKKEEKKVRFALGDFSEIAPRHTTHTILAGGEGGGAAQGPPRGPRRMARTADPPGRPHREYFLSNFRQTTNGRSRTAPP